MAQSARRTSKKTRDDYPTDAAYVICEEIMPAWESKFLQKNADYGDTFEMLGSKGEFASIWRKVRKLKRAMWDEEEMNFEGVDEMLEDLVGHCLLALYMRNNEEVDGD